MTPLTTKSMYVGEWDERIWVLYSSLRSSSNRAVPLATEAVSLALA